VPSTRLRPVGHDDRLSLVEHLDELRTRLVWCALAFGVALAFCFWQNDRIIDIVNRPLEHTTLHARSGGLEGSDRQDTALRADLRSDIAVYSSVLASKTVRGDPQLRATLRAEIARKQKTLDALPKSPGGRQPVTLGVGEPFTQTFTLSAYFALLISLPFLLYQLYAFVLPAFNPREKQVVVPLLAMIPALFIAGVVFGYYVVLPPAIKFLQNFNDSSFDILVQARDYYRFVATALMGLGILFQIPVGILALTRLGVVTPRQLRKNRRYALVVIAVIAMLLPGTDPVTMLLSMLPLLVLFEASILLSALLERRMARQAATIEPAISNLDLED
jgi:sec-independent protein translocase protein TatC